MDQTEFLSQLFGSEEGLVCLARVGSGGEMIRQWVSYPPSEPYLDQEWPYFLPALFDEPEGAGKTKVIAVNIDEIDNLPQTISPSLVVNTSPVRVVGYYLLSEWISFEEARTLAYKLAPTSDPSAYVRLPGLRNEKYAKPYQVEVTRAALVAYQVSVLRRLPDPNGTGIKTLSNWTWEPVGVGPKEYLRNLVDQNRVPSRLMGQIGFDDALEIISNAAGLNDEEKIYVLKNLASNPYRSLAEVGRETAKIYARYLVRHTSETGSLLLELDRARKSRTGVAFVRHQNITNIAYRELASAGQFIHTVDDRAFYIERDTGKAIELTSRSEQFKYLIVRRLRVNPVDREFRHLVEDTIARVMNQPGVGIPSNIAFFDGNTKSLTVSLGGMQCLRLGASSVELVENGTNNLIFRTPPKFEPVAMELIDFDSDLSGWWKEFFPGMPTLMGMTEPQAAALLRVWLTFFFFQSGATTWPLLVYTGQMGSGKSATARGIYRLLYGIQMDLIRMRNQNAFDTALSNHALAQFDNVDTRLPWLPESLATAISRTEDDRRKLWTDNDLYSVRNQAMVTITSKDLPFLKEDVIDRMLFFQLLRFEDLGITPIPEQQFHDKTTANRHRYISGLLQDCRKVLATPRPTLQGIQWRIADFVDIGYWIASSLGIEKDFVEGLTKLKRQQRGLTLEGDQALVTALESFAARCKDADRWRTSNELREDLLLYSTSDVETALASRYKSATSLSSKLFSIIGALKQVVPIEYEFNETTGFKRWRIRPNGAP